MKKFFLFLVLSVFVGSLSAQQTVQGIPHPNAKKVSIKSVKKAKSSSFTFEDIEFWVGDGNNKAALLIEWHEEDNDDWSEHPDGLVWGYRWDTGVEKTGFDMIKAVAETDPRLMILAQYTGWMGYTIDGIGYDNQPIDVTFDLDGASSDYRISFNFSNPNSGMGQIGAPVNAAADAAAAVAVGQQTGFIDHPFNARTYGYAAYDYDYWQVDRNQYPGVHWYAGWYDGYWSYFVKDSENADFSYSGLGASSRKLINNAWDAWSWNGDMTTWTGTEPGSVFNAASPMISLNHKQVSLPAGTTVNLTADLDLDFVNSTNVTWISKNPACATVDNNGVVRAVNSGVTEIKAVADGKYNAFCTVTVTGTARTLSDAQINYSDNVLYLKNLKGYTGYINSIYGNQVAVSKIASENETKQLNLSSGVYTFTGINGEEKVSLKFIVK